MDAPRLSIVLPCYNEARSLPLILERYREAGLGRDFELILVDNGSRDETSEVLGRLLPWYPFARSVRVDVNQGYGHGIWTGLRAGRGEVLAWSHADMQTDPADVFRAMDLWGAEQKEVKPNERKSVLVKGRRYGRKLSERFISFGMQVLATVLLRTRLSEINAQPKLFSRELICHLDSPPVDFNFDVYVLYRARQNGWQIKSFPVLFPPRQHGQSHWAATWKSRLRTIAKSIRYLFRLAVGLNSSCSVSGREVAALNRRAA